jgi:hypothetical protein
MKARIENAVKLIGEQQLSFLELRRLLMTEMQIRAPAAEVLIDQLQRKNMLQVQLQGVRTIYSRTVVA